MTDAEDSAARAAREVAARYEDVQRRVTQFSVVEQQLINARNALDREFARLERLNHFSARAVQHQTAESLLSVVAEAVVDIFEVEIGLFWPVLEDGTLGPASASPEGCARAQALVEAGRWLLEDGRADSAAVLDLAALPELPRLMGLRHAVVAPCHDSTRRLRGLLLGGITEAGAAFFDPVTPEQCQSFRLVAQQIAALIESLGTRALVEQQFALRRAKEEAERANRAKSSFLANMSHEIRTPINAVMGMAYLMTKTSLTDKQQDYVRKIQHSSEHLLGIINDVLDYSRIESGMLTVESISFALVGVLEKVTTVVEDRAEAKGLTLVVSVDEGVPNNLLGDPLRLAQILLNYVTNAVKFSEHGQVHLRVALEDSTSADVALRFEVEDCGIGLTEAQIALLFRSFQQADSSTTRQFGGSGLGLAICKQLAGLMGGDVGVRSVYGHGSTFWFRVRLRRGTSLWRLVDLQGALAGKRALVVDDGTAPCPALLELLKTMQMRPTTVGSGAEAVALLHALEEPGDDYAFVFVDSRLPGMADAEWARRLQALPRAEQRSIVLLSAEPTEELTKTADEAGICGVLAKPVSASALFECVSRVYGKSAGNAQQRLLLGSPVEVELHTIRGAELLLVEDNVLNQEVAIEILTDVGFIVSLARNGQEAVSMAEAQDFDLVLMDMQMPVMDGITATRALRAVPRLSALPIVAMTANAMQAERAACLAAGMDDHVAKPIDPPLLFRTLLRWIRPRSGLGQPRAFDARSPVEAPLEDIVIPVVEGLDTEAALHRLLGKKALYVALLRRFAESQSRAPGEVELALEAGDWSTAERLAHTLKGVSASLGLGALGESAARLEAGLKGRAERAALNESLRDCAQRLQAFVLALLPQLPRLEVTPALVALDEGEFLTVARRLAGLLESDDVDAGKVSSEQGALLRAGLQEAYPDIEAAIQGYDFASAYRLLSAALEASGRRL